MDFLMRDTLNQIYQKGVHLWIANDQLGVRAPQGILTPNLKIWLQEHKSEIIVWLKDNPNISNQNCINLDLEATLAPDIYPQEKISPVEFLPKTILLTGATGFLGAFLLRDILAQTQADIYCLVRAKDRQSGAKRLQENLEYYGIWQKEFKARIIPLLGDLAQPQFGLSSEEYQALAREIDTIYHSAAFLNWVYPYSALKGSNVLGTQEVLRLACCHKVKPVHYVSTVAVFESTAYGEQIVAEADRPTHSQGIYLGYSQSKWVAERLVLEASDRGLPVCIYRAPFISGDSHTGSWFTDDFICRLFKGCLQMGTIPDLDYLVEMSPVDYISQAIIYLSAQPQFSGRTFHLMNPHPFHLSQLGNWLNNFGYAVKSIPYSEWLAQLETIPLQENNPLKSLLPFFSKSWLEPKLTLPELYQQNFKPRFNCQATLAALSESDIVCPPLNSTLLNTYFKYFINTKFLPPPPDTKVHLDLNFLTKHQNQSSLKPAVL
ncbi:thioester reductase domain-containing protein [Microcoleus sp. D2_18a_D3]|uniref:thioester reductase domain-containing protein n=1 Tax=Microcoleus sp. D2_18a_D3 TaxID=3055330 RepID=UPI002FD72FD0